MLYLWLRLVFLFLNVPVVLFYICIEKWKGNGLFPFSNVHLLYETDYFGHYNVKIDFLHLIMCLVLSIVKL